MCYSWICLHLLFVVVAVSVSSLSLFRMVHVCVSCIMFPFFFQYLVLLVAIQKGLGELLNSYLKQDETYFS